MIYRILYLGYYVYEINILDMTRDLCQFVAQFLVLSLTLKLVFHIVNHDHGDDRF